MNITTVLTGQVFYVSIIAVLLTIPVSLLLMRQYQKAVIKGMSTKTDHADELPIRNESAKSERPPLTFVSLDLSQDSQINPWVKKIQSTMRRSSMVYGISGFAFVSIMTAAILLSEFSSISPVRFIFIALALSCPIVLITNLIKAASPKESLINWAIYGSLFIAVGIYGMVRSPTLTFGMVIVSWFLWNTIPLLFLQFLTYKRIRSVGTIVFALLLISMTGVEIADTLLISNTTFQNTYIFLAGLLSFGNVSSAVILLDIIRLGSGMIFAIPIGWLFMRLIGSLYANKSISDQSIRIDLIWIIYGYFWSMELVFHGLVWFLAGLLAFVVYKIICAIGFRLTKSSRMPSPNLLLLRVFSLGERSENLYSLFSRFWRYIGTIRFINGPDLIKSTIHPHQLLNFLGGSLSSLFVGNRASLEKRMQNLDNATDPDQRYRINDFYCHDNTWKMVLKKLADESNIVLMDLRSFSTKNMGCKFEIDELFEIVPLNKVVFVVDDTTDKQFMSDNMNDAWRNLSATSPNLDFNGEVQLFEYKNSGRKELEKLILAVTSMLDEQTSEAV